MQQFIKIKAEISIKTKVNDPFIYFCAEPKVVFVYHIKGLDYITVADLMDGSKLESFEINEDEDFETFDHKDKKLPEGRSFFMSHREIAGMAEVINGVIQEKRNAKEEAKQSGAVHLVASESSAGSLRVAIERPKTVIGFPDAFSIGPLWKLNEQTGQSFRKEWLFDHINYEQEDVEYANKFTNALREIEDIADHIPIYIWYGNNAEEQTGLRFYLYLLREGGNKIFLMNVTELDGEADLFHTGLADSEKLKGFFANTRKIEPVTTEMKAQYLKEWEELSEKKDVLRVWIDDQIKSVSEDYYDALIIDTLKALHREQESEDFIMAGKVIGEIAADKETVIDSFFLEYRIRTLVYTGVFEMKGIPKSMRHYRIKLRGQMTGTL